MRCECGGESHKREVTRNDKLVEVYEECDDCGRVRRISRDIFHAALASAKRYGLTWEFISFYKRFRRSGDSIHEAAMCARYEWDL